MRTSTATVVVTEIDWGSLEPGEIKTFNAYVKNYGDVPFNMTLSTDNWNPTQAETYITVGWDYNGQTVSVGEVLPVTFSLEVSESAPEGSFSNDIIIRWKLKSLGISIKNLPNRSYVIFPKPDADLRREFVKDLLPRVKKALDKCLKAKELKPEHYRALSGPYEE